MKTNRMRVMSRYTLNLCIALGMVTFLCGVVACNNEEDEKRRKALNDLDVYVKTHHDSVDMYLDREWEEIDREYAEKSAAVEQNEAKLDAESKAKYQQSKTEWESFKSDYNQRQEERRKQMEAAAFKGSLIPADIAGDMSHINKSNLAAVYTHFVNIVDEHKKEYSKDQWEVVDKLYEDLDTIKDSLDKDITRADNLKIQKEKFRYSNIKTTYKTFSENPDH